MSSNQTLILEAIETRITALNLGRTLLDYSYDLEKNNTRGETSSYGYGVGSGDVAEGTLKAITLDQSFFVVLTENFINRSSDSKEVAALKLIYNDLEVIYQDFTSSKLGINTTVLVVGGFTLDEPDKISENTISVKATFTVKHRKQLT